MSSRTRYPWTSAVTMSCGDAPAAAPGRRRALCSPMDLLPTVLDLLALPMSGFIEAELEEADVGTYSHMVFDGGLYWIGYYDVANGNLKLAGLQLQVKSMFELTRLHRVFEIYTDAAEALSSFQQ